jgi:carboxyl-terminal processing protease
MKRKMIKHGNKVLNLLLLFFILFFVSCDRNETPLPDNNEVGKEFVYKTTTSYYLWEQYIPTGISTSSYSDPYTLFEAMNYDDLDRWSFVTDDYDALQNSLDGITKSAGFYFQGFRYTEGADDVFLIVEYVKTEGTAYAAGLERGDVIIAINGTNLTANNYYDLISQENLTLKIGALNDGSVVDLNETISVTKVQQSFSPILKQQVITASNGKKVGYFLYDQFISDYDDDMISVINSFKGQGIDELVLDLRYNPGGYVSTSALLASMIVPSINLDDIFLTYQWNNLVTSELGSNPDYEYLFREYFPEPSVNLDLSTLYVLTSNGTASASELIINCLKPYMSVIVIGERTHGKNTSAIPFYDTEKKHNWGLYLVTSLLANANGFSDYADGFTPDHEIQDDYTTPLGDETEPLLAQALSLITGAPVKKIRDKTFRKF